MAGGDVPDALDEYLEKRDLERTPEPGPGDRTGQEEGEGPLFVIQEHDASSHHFDFRLQVGGVLRSWAVPKGPSTDPSEKRLAVPTEDHPLGYADFEGVIPEDEYGGGTVVVWDAGTWTHLKEDEDGEPVPMEDQLEAGHATFRLHGEKVRGGWSLTRFRGEDDDEEERWLLVKMDDDEADARRNPTSTEPESVLSGRTLEEVAEKEEPETPEAAPEGEEETA